MKPITISKEVEYGYIIEDGDNVCGDHLHSGWVAGVAGTDRIGRDRHTDNRGRGTGDIRTDRYRNTDRIKERR